MNGKRIVPQVVGMALGSIAVWAADVFGGVKVPAEIAVAVGTVVSVVISVLTPDDMEAE
jgi:hypothetical protein